MFSAFKRRAKKIITVKTKAALYNYVEQPLAATPGTGNWAFLPSFSLPLTSVSGPGNAFYKNWGAQPGNVMYGQAQVVSGVEGVYAPGIQPQPLIDMAAHIAMLDNLSGGVNPIAKE